MGEAVEEGVVEGGWAAEAVFLGIHLLVFRSSCGFVCLFVCLLYRGKGERGKGGKEERGKGGKEEKGGTYSGSKEG